MREDDGRLANLTATYTAHLAKAVSAFPSRFATVNLGVQAPLDVKEAVRAALRTELATRFNVQIDPKSPFSLLVSESEAVVTRLPMVLALSLIHI